MSDKEEKDRHKTVVEPTVFVVNQQSSADNRIQSYPSDMQDEANEAIHKRSKIPGIPSVAPDLKEASTAQHIEVKKQESSERNTQTPLSTELPKYQASSMLSSNSHLPEIAKPCETVVLGTMESEPVLKVIPSEPIPLEIKPKKSKESVRSDKTAGEEVSDEEALSDDIAVLPTREVTRLSDWEASEETLDFQNPSNEASPEQGMPWRKPCGITLRLPQRSMTDFTATTKTGIHIVISKASLMESQRHLTIAPMTNKPMPMDGINENMATSQSDEQFSPHHSSVLREKFDMMCSKIKHYFNR